MLLDKCWKILRMGKDFAGNINQIYSCESWIRIQRQNPSSCVRRWKIWQRFRILRTRIRLQNSNAFHLANLRGTKHEFWPHLLHFGGTKLPKLHSVVGVWCFTGLLCMWPFWFVKQPLLRAWIASHSVRHSVLLQHGSECASAGQLAHRVALCWF